MPRTATKSIATEKIKIKNRWTHVVMNSRRRQMPRTATKSIATEKIKIKNRWTHVVMFTAEVEIGLATADLKLGAAIKIAVNAGANLAGANLARANLADANLADANLADANLAGANLADANLAGANLTRANLADANLAGANLTRANLAGAYLAGANLARAKSLLDCGSPHGWRIVVVAHEDGIMISAGCRWFTFSAAVSHWQNRDDRQLMQPLLAYIKAACQIKGWKLEA